MRKRRLALLLPLGIVIMITAALAGTVIWLNSGALREMAVEALHQATGREIHVASARLRLGWPLTVELRNTRIDNAAWGQAPFLTSVPVGQATLATSALFSGHLRLRDIQTQHALLNLERNKQGDWNLPTGGSGSSASDTPLPTIELRDTALRYRGPSRSKPLEIHFNRVRTERNWQPARVEVSAGPDRTVNIRAGHGLLRELLSTDGAKTVNFTAHAKSNRIAFKGQLGIKPFKASGQLDIDTPAPTKLAKALGLPEPGMPSISLHTDVDVRPQTSHLRNLTAHFGEREITGALTLARTNGTHPKLTGNLALAALPISLGGLCSNDKTSASPSASTVLKRFPAWLMVLNVKVKQLKCGDKPAGSLDARLRWQKNKLYYDLRQLQLFTGQFTASGLLTPERNGSSRLRIDSHLDSLDLSAIADMAGIGDTPLAGQIRGRAKLALSLPDGLSTANGQIALFMSDGTLPRRVIERAVLDLGSLTVAKGPNRVELKCAAAAMTLKNGKGTIKTLVARTPNALIVADGSVDFDTHTLALRIQADSDQVAFFDLSVPIRIKGPFNNPKVSVNAAAAIAQGGAKALLGIVAAPLAAAASFLGGEIQAQCDLPGQNTDSDG